MSDLLYIQDGLLLLLWFILFLFSWRLGVMIFGSFRDVWGYVSGVFWGGVEGLLSVVFMVMFGERYMVLVVLVLCFMDFVLAVWSRYRVYGWSVLRSDLALGGWVFKLVVYLSLVFLGGLLERYLGLGGGLMYLLCAGLVAGELKSMDEHLVLLLGWSPLSVFTKFLLGKGGVGRSGGRGAGRGGSRGGVGRKGGVGGMGYDGC